MVGFGCKIVFASPIRPSVFTSATATEGFSQTSAHLLRFTPQTRPDSSLLGRQYVWFFSKYKPN